MTLVEKLRGLLASASPGPWTKNGCAVEAGDIGVCGCGSWSPESKGAGNCALIVAAVNALPKLLAVVEAAERLLKNNTHVAERDAEDALRALEASE